MAHNMSNGQAANGVADKKYTIRVGNLPTTLEEKAIKLMFEKYGKVTAMMVFPSENTQQAFISYAKYVEAETAINALNKEAPLDLEVEFKDKDLKMRSHQEDIKIQLDKPYHDYRFQQSHLDDQTNMKKAINMGKPKCTPSPYQVSNYTTDDELLCPVPTDPSMYNPYDQPGPHKDLNLMYIRGLAQVMKDGRRRIDENGRGYIFYDLPEPHHNINNLIAGVCEKRDSGYYEYAPDDIADDSGICKICSSPTAFRCQKCNLAFYCSRPCQLKDWPQHKVDCQAIPGLVKRKPVQNGHETPVQNGHQPSPKTGYEASQKNDRETSPKNQMDAHQREPGPQLRRPKPLSQQQQQQPQHHQNQHQEHQQNTTRLNREQQQQQSPPRFNRNQQQQQQRSPANVTQEKAAMPPKSPSSVKSHRSTDINRQTPVSTFKAESTSFPAKQQKPAPTKSVPSDDGISFGSPKTWFISKTDYDRVIINTILEKGEYWVQKIEAVDFIGELMKKVEDFAKNKTLVEPYIHQKCILKHDDSWYRTVIHGFQDDSVMAFFVDFGTFSVCKIEGVVPMDGFEDIPTQARKIRFVENTDPELMDLELTETVYVRAIDISETGTFIVEAKKDRANIKSETPLDEVPPATSPQASNSAAVPKPPYQIAIEKLARFPNWLNKLEVGQEGAMMIHAQLAIDEMNISLIPAGRPCEQFELLLNALFDACNAQVAKDPNYVPIIGDFICGEQLPGEWYRGIVISKNPIKVAVVDEARVFVPAKCTPLPTGYKDLPGYGVLAKLSTPCAKLSGRQASFKVLKVSESKDSAVISVDATSDEDPPFTYIGEATLSVWTPKPEQKGIQWAKLTSGKEVQIIEAFTHNMIYVHSKDPEEAERRHRLEQEIAKCALNRKPLRELPVVGQIVMAFYANDGNYYRAYVVRVTNQTNIQIKYVDYGNEANVKFDELFELPDHLKEERACAAKIKLKGVEDNVSMTEQATAYLSELIAHEVALTCTFTGNQWENGVVLKTPRNEIVNDLMSSYLKPTWQQNNNEELVDKPLFLIDQLPVLKIGDVGDQVQALVLCFYEDPPSLMLAPNDDTAIEAISVDMSQKIQEYVKNTPNHYIPRDRELCIALFDGTYYRAVCMNSSASPTESRVMFIDYGNTECVKHKEIRMMTEEFMSIGSLATLCCITPMVPDEKLTPTITKRISELLPLNEQITVKIISEDADGVPSIDIPEIRVKLIEEKLL